MICMSQFGLLLAVLLCAGRLVDSLNMTPKFRVALRATANKLKIDKKLHTIPFSNITPNSIQNVRDSLCGHELVLLRLNALEKKADAQEIGDYVCTETNCELIQIIGHTLLLYKAGKPPKLVP